jgi:antitoxin ParD1/3/4
VSKIEKVSLTLTPRQVEALREAVDEGVFATMSEAARSAIEEWADRRSAQRQAAIERIRQLWNEGLASGVAERRRTPEEIKAEGRRRLDALNRRA